MQRILKHSLEVMHLQLKTNRFDVAKANKRPIKCLVNLLFLKLVPIQEE